MNCPETQQRLSEYHDGRLSDAVRVQVEAHLGACEVCSAELQGLVRLSAAARELRQTTPASELWNRIERNLDGASAPENSAVAVAASQAAASDRLQPAPSTEGGAIRRGSGGRLALVVGVLICAVAGTTAWFTQRHSHDGLAVDFDRYLNAYARNPHEAAHSLFADYPAEEVDLATAARRVGYTPVVANSLPAGYTLDSVQVLSMPCCLCVKSVCRDNHGNPIVVFEHDAAQPVWFGDRPMRQCECGGKSTTVIEFDSQLAATWRVGKRSVTVIGARDEEQVARLMPWLGRDPATG